MQKYSTSPFTRTVKDQWLKMALLGCLLSLFLCNAIGLIHFGSNGFPSLSLNLNYFRNPSGEFNLPPIAASTEFLLLLASGVLLVVCLPLLNPTAASILVFILSIPPVWIAVTFPYRNNTIPVQFDLLVFLVLFGTNVLMLYFTETREKQKLLDTFSQYLPASLVTEISEKPKNVILVGESRLLTIMFCDLRNFTAMSERLSPQEVVSILNDYFTAMTTILFKYGATIDKYVGDSIMAFWGAPLRQEDHALRAVQASFEMHKEMKSLAKSFSAHGLPTPAIGIGINTGVVNAGNMGSRHRLSYTVIGDAVNLASRMQKTTKAYGVVTIVGEQTANQCPAILFRELDKVVLRGKTSLSRIYEPLCLKSKITPKLYSELTLHNEALAHVYQGKNEHATQLFSELINLYPDQPYYHLMQKKLTHQST